MSVWGWVRRVARTLLELEVIDRSMALAGQVFAALLPLLIVLGSVSRSDGRDVANSFIERFKLSGDGAATLRAAMAPQTEVRSGTSVLSVVLLVVAALAFTRALQRLYTRVWRLESLGWRGSLWGVVWLGAFCVYWSLQPVIVQLLDGAAATATSLVLSAVLWLFTPWLLLARTIRWHRLLPQAILTAASLTALGAVSAYYLPRAVAASGRQFGFIGAAFDLLSWLFVASFVVVAAAVAGAPATGTHGAAADTRE
jgi:membrane protein